MVEKSGSCRAWSEIPETDVLMYITRVRMHVYSSLVNVSRALTITYQKHSFGRDKSRIRQFQKDPSVEPHLYLKLTWR